jgi:uncharacterized LabA/DUF88 family protein
MKTAVLIDGGFLRASAKAASKNYTVSLIEAFAKACVEVPEYLLRVLYYDSPQFTGTVKLPVSGEPKSFQANNRWLDELARSERFAVRRGALGFRGWIPKSIPIAGTALTDNDFTPSFEQKGVDMRIGLDIAVLSDRKSVERILLVSGDTDMVPAMKHARKTGVEVAVVQIPPPAKPLHNNLLMHADLVRSVALP